MARPQKYDIRTVDDLTYMRWQSMRSRVKKLGMSPQEAIAHKRWSKK